MIFLAVDSMDDFFRVGVFAWDVNDNLYLLEVSECHDLELSEEQRAKQNEENKAAGRPPVVTVEDMLMKSYLVKDGVGITPLLCVVDQGGHRGDEVKHFARFHSQVVQWKGSSMSSANWKMSENQRQLVIANEKHYRASIIYTLYSQTNKSQNYFFMSPDISEEYVSEIVDVKPDESSKWGHLPENWSSKSRKRSYMGCLQDGTVLERLRASFFEQKQIQIWSSSIYFEKIRQSQKAPGKERAEPSEKLFLANLI